MQLSSSTLTGTGQSRFDVPSIPQRRLRNELKPIATKAEARIHLTT